MPDEEPEDEPEEESDPEEAAEEESEPEEAAAEPEFVASPDPDEVEVASGEESLRAPADEDPERLSVL